MSSFKSFVVRLIVRLMGIKRVDVEALPEIRHE